MSKNKFIQQVESSQLRQDIPEFSQGDTVVVQVRVVEGSRERLQPFEGIDQRIVDSEVDEECSIGGYILSGGELPALIVMDSITRTIEGVLGDADSVKTDTFSDGLLKHPQYTRPESGSYGDVPEILLSGDHESIRRWQLKQSLLKTRKNRPDLLEIRSLNDEEQELLEEILREEQG